MRLSTTLAFGGTAILLFAGPARSDTLTFTAQLANDVGAPQTTAAKGSVAFSLDTGTKTVSWTIEYAGLPQPVKMVGCGALEAASGPSIQLTSNLASPIKGSKSLTDAEIGSLRAGHWVCLVGSGDDDAELGGQLQPAR